MLKRMLVILALIFGSGVATAAPAYASGCLPNAGFICFYDSTNFNNFLWQVGIVGSCDGHGQFVALADQYRNRVESVRNRTGCGVFLYYYCGTSICHNEWMAPYTEDGTISPLNAIDGWGIEYKGLPPY